MSPSIRYDKWQLAEALYHNPSHSNATSAKCILEGLASYGLVKQLAGGDFKITAAGRQWLASLDN
jgi:predicted transcriptional regulator